ncbi:gliding motility protein GldM [Mucilaginibacter sp. JRF]|uniref:type IX secretion system motor protein PorM/GldM n=1 Tax=Mucilaginibacter sp. JRF TaxID=2780088 RepID=UPI00187F9CEA|nr:gliding motility protein GldM [Mucilaginibacter sp. JRF]MBE9585659.1 gliding motility protein GldM [Mucilaginibacter sp. JRF]
MAGGKQTPRQRMIGILYLVLLGLVALNVPDSLLDAFKNITDSLDQSRTNVSTSIQNTYSAFEQTKLKEQPERAKPIYDKAKEASKISEELDAYVESLRKQLVEEGGGINETTGDVEKRDNLDISPRIMINGKNADVLKQKIEETRDKLLALLDAKDRDGVNFSLNTTEPKTTPGNTKKSWQQAYFGNGIPLGATLTTLSKIQSDAKNAENEVVKKLLGKVDQAVVNLDKFAAVAVAPSSYVVAGQPYTAEIFLTAYDSKSNPTITVNGSTLQVSEGRGKYTVNTSKEGFFKYSGTIKVVGTDGQTKTYQLPMQEYQVAKPSAVVSPDKMNVLYIGVPNPISVSAPGVPLEKLRVSAPGATIKGANGKYTATVSSIGTVKVSVSGEVAPGKTQVLGVTEFRVKRIPDPKAMFAGKSGGSTSSANIRGQERLFARLENFEFDAKFEVTRFSLLLAKPRQDVIKVTSTSGSVSPQMRAALNTVTPGTKVIFTDIMAVGPDGSQRGLDDIVISAN